MCLALQYSLSSCASTTQVIQRRLRNALTEMRFKDSGLFDEILVNDDVDTCVASLEAILAKYDLLLASPESTAAPTAGLAPPTSN